MYKQMDKLVVNQHGFLIANANSKLNVHNIPQKNKEITQK